jgi:hypothetical protein
MAIFTTLKSRTDDRALLHESVPITGTIISGTYADENIKNYTHGMFQSVYDYPFLSSSANHIFDIANGYSPSSAMASKTPASTQNSKKINMYNLHAQQLVGYDPTGSILEFDRDGTTAIGGTKMKECIFLDFTRLLVKDEIKKGSLALTFLTGGAWGSRTDPLTVYDANGETSFKVSSPAGEFGLLYTSSVDTTGDVVGHLYYQAGIAVLTASVFRNFGTPGNVTFSVDQTFVSASITGAADALRHRIGNFQFNNTTELNSSIYFCRVSADEGNYSSNPTYLTASQLRVKNVAGDQPVSYVTTVGLYSADNELLAVAKLSEPLKKTPSEEFTLRVRLDY